MVKKEISRRELLKTAAAASASYVALKENAILAAASSDAGSSFAQQSGGQILPLLSTSEVFVPPRGRSFVKFSFDFPEPSVEFAGLRFSFRVFTFENAYTFDAGRP